MNKSITTVLLSFAILASCSSNEQQNDRLELLPEPDKQIREANEAQSASSKRTNVEKPAPREQAIDFELPEGITYKGNLKQGLRWTDNEGDHVAFITETGIYQSKFVEDGELSENAEIFAYHYILEDGIPKQTWKVHDFIKECMVDVEAEYLPKTFQVTDLDNDGTKEVWMMYKTVCHGDVSPCDMKIIMYEGVQKYAVRGQNKVRLSGTEAYGGEYKMDATFQNGPREFKTFAQKLWADNVLQVWGDE